MSIKLDKLESPVSAGDAPIPNILAFTLESLIICRGLPTLEPKCKIHYDVDNPILIIIIKYFGIGL